MARQTTSAQLLEQFWRHCPVVMSAPGLIATSAAHSLLEVASAFRRNSDHLAAGLTTYMARFGLIRDPTSILIQANQSQRALEDYAAHLRGTPDSITQILTLMKSYQELYRFHIMPRKDGADLATQRNSICAQLSYLCRARFAHQSPSYLVNGFRVEGPLLGPWTAHELGDQNSYTHVDPDARTLSFRIDPAIDLLIELGDYTEALALTRDIPPGQVTSRLAAWQAALEGLTGTDVTGDAFDRASRLFRSVVPDPTTEPDDLMKCIGLWPTHFSIRAHLARARLEPSRLLEHVRLAAVEAGRHVAVRDRAAIRFSLLVRAMGALSTEDGNRSLLEARKCFDEEFEANPEFYDGHVQAFFDYLHRALQATDNTAILTNASLAIGALNKLPILGGPEPATLTEAVSRHIGAILEGVDRSWIHEAFSSIKLESELRTLLLTLFRNDLPHYAQIRHGPFEFGGDLAVASTASGVTTLSIYQAKCGDISKTMWNKQVRPQLEEIFQVPMDAAQIPVAINQRVGVLVWNGHFKPSVEKIAEEWRIEQRTRMNRLFEFMNIDALVGFVIRERLLATLRSATTRQEAGRDHH